MAVKKVRISKTSFKFVKVTAKQGRVPTTKKTTKRK